LFFAPYRTVKLKKRKKHLIRVKVICSLLGCSETE
jgi:hypothetical protein